MMPRQGATLHVSRREFLAGAPLFLGVVASFRRGVVQDSLAGSGPAGKLWDPARAGRSLEPSTAADNDAAFQAIEKQLKCTCGCGLDVYTCRTTDFSCTVSPALHRRVIALSDQGLTAQQVLDDFVAREGQQILMAPPKRGFNLAAYFVPSLLILVVGAILTVALRRWARTATAAAAAAPAVSGPDAGGRSPSAAELEQLHRELDQFSA